MYLALLLLLAASPDPVGSYLSHFGTDPDATYQVLVTREADGTLRTAWGTIGLNPITHYQGVLTYDKKTGEWTETYDAPIAGGPALRSCSPWRWRVEQRRPLIMYGGNWDLQRR